MLSIGEFSKVTAITIKALRLYHNQEILIPDHIDEESGYRYYKSRSVLIANRINTLKEMGFSLKEIKQILTEHNNDEQLIQFMENKMQEINRKINHYHDMQKNLSVFISNTKEQVLAPPFVIDEQIIDDMIICGMRFKGKYTDIAFYLPQLMKKVKRHCKGKPFTQYYDNEYKEDGADLEICIEVKESLTIAGIQCRELKGGQAVTSFHRGPYERLDNSYQKIFEYCRENSLVIQFPIREFYLKGPGIIFKGNPNKYLTKIVAMYELNKSSLV